jgi:hypothetical protein
MKETKVRNKRASIDRDIAVKHPLNAFKDGRVVNAPSSRDAEEDAASEDDFNRRGGGRRGSEPER